MEATGGMSASLPELDLLLTGGRLEAKHAVQAAYHQRNGWKAPWNGWKMWKTARNWMVLMTFFDGL